MSFKRRERASFVSGDRGVVARVCEDYAQLYEHRGVHYPFCVTFNPKRRSVTLSHDGVDGFSAVDFMRGIWPDAVGNKSIARSPIEVSEKKWLQVVDQLREKKDEVPRVSFSYQDHPNPHDHGRDADSALPSLS
jgi:hypothetical protein